MSKFWAKRGRKIIGPFPTRREALEDSYPMAMAERSLYGRATD